MPRAAALLLALGFLAAGLAQGAIYKITGPDGKVTYSDAPPPAPAAGKSPAQVKEIPIQSFSGPAQQGSVAAPDWQAVLQRKPEAAAVSITMFATDWCGYCKAARSHLKARGIAYSELDIEKNPAAMAAFKRAGGRGVPFFVIGQRTLSGFSPGALDAALAAAR